MKLNKYQEFTLYLFYSYYLLNKDHKNDNLYNEILSICINNFNKESEDELNKLAQYIDYIFNYLNISIDDSRKYTNHKNTYNYNFIYNIYIKSLRKHKLNIIL